MTCNVWINLLLVIFWKQFKQWIIPVFCNSKTAFSAAFFQELIHIFVLRIIKHLSAMKIVSNQSRQSSMNFFLFLWRYNTSFWTKINRYPVTIVRCEHVFNTYIYIKRTEFLKTLTIFPLVSSISPLRIAYCTCFDCF